MQYRLLGQTGIRVSQLGFGAMRLPMVGDGETRRVDRDRAIPMMHRAFEHGVNYIDTAVGYCNQDSQCAVGEALQGWRDRVVVSTKNPSYAENERDWWQNLENSMQRLRIDTIDIYNHHGLNWERYQQHVEPRIAAWMQKARDQGLIRHICCSFHDTNDALIKLVDSGYPEVITLQYNLLDRRLEEGIAHAAEKGIGIVVMGPVGGGRLGVPSTVLESVVPDIGRVPELALRFVLANHAVALALSGMSTVEQVEENLAVASDKVTLSEDDHDSIDSHLQRLERMKDLYCTGCGYCMPCEAGVDIPAVFNARNLERVYGLKEAARERYRTLLRRGKGADRCVVCGKCVSECPQNLSIPDELKAAHEALRWDNGAPAC